MGVDEERTLAPWSAVAEYANWTGILVGNGASIVVWPKFHYNSLFAVATSEAVEHQLTDDDRALFDAFKTRNFEHVLASLKTAGQVAEALDVEFPVVEARYDSIQRGLFEAVHAVHVEWDYVSKRTIPELFEILRRYKYVYSTNYDLLLYWASMHEGGPPFLDYFWGENKSFEVTDTEIWATRERWTRILFIHGGIHLRRLRGGGTRKVVAEHGSILEQFSTAYSDEESPLLVSEGDSEDKLSSIRSSDYLTFAHQMLATHEGGLVIFGHSLSNEDDHLVAPMRTWRGSPIAISMRPTDDEDALIQAKDRYRSRLSPMKDVVFFDASTHPLGNSDLAARAPLSGLFGRR